jgi:hypothetical protein
MDMRYSTLIDERYSALIEVRYSALMNMGIHQFQKTGILSNSGRNVCIEGFGPLNYCVQKPCHKTIDLYKTVIKENNIF